MKLEKPSINYVTDLDECLICFKILFEYAQFWNFFELPKLLSHFNYLLGKKVPKLLESYGLNAPYFN